MKKLLQERDLEASLVEPQETLLLTIPMGHSNVPISGIVSKVLFDFYEIWLFHAVFDARMASSVTLTVLIRGSIRSLASGTL